MFRSMFLTAAAALTTLGSTWTPTAHAQFSFPVNLPGIGGQQHHRHFHVEYRQLQWREQTFCHSHEAHRFLNDLRNRGFQVHHFHVGQDTVVRYRLPIWTRYRTVDSHFAAHQLERWMESRGYDARVVHH